MVATTLTRRTPFGVPRTRGRSRTATMVWAVVVLVLVGLALGLRIVRWADRNL